MKARASDITAEIHIQIPGYGLLILPLSCATLIPCDTGAVKTEVTDEV
jgi:hypothetical protein